MVNRVDSVEEHKMPNAALVKSDVHPHVRPKAKSILVLCPKGGVAKSTTVENLIVSASNSGLKTLAIDTDPQGSVSKWYTRRCERSPTKEAGFDIARVELTHWRNVWDQLAEWDIAIIDTPPSIDAYHAPVQALAKQVDYIIIPVSTSLDELEIAISWMGELRDNGAKKIQFLLTRIPDLRRRAYAEAQTLLAPYGLILPQIIPEREEVRTAANIGDAVVEYEGAKGQREYALLWQHLKIELNISTSAK